MKSGASFCETEPDFSARNPAPNFDRLARVYRWMEWASFGPFLCWCRCAFLGEMRTRRRALVIGDGDGRFAARLLKANQAIRLDAVDASGAMLRALAKRAGPNAARVQTVCADARAFQPESADLPETAGLYDLRLYDLIATHFFLDCLTTEEVRALAGRVRTWAAPNAIWAISEFAIPQGWFGRLFARPIVSNLYRAFGLLTGLRQRLLPDHASALRTAGFELARRRTYFFGLLVSELWQAGETRA